jgi:hypothetical protein
MPDIGRNLHSIEHYHSRDARKRNNFILAYEVWKHSSSHLKLTIIETV